MPTENRYMTFGLMLGVRGMGIGVGLVIASFIEPAAGASAPSAAGANTR